MYLLRREREVLCAFCQILLRFKFYKFLKQLIDMPEKFDSSGFGGEIKRAVTKPRKIEEIDREDIRVSIIGTLVNKGKGSLIVDDGSGNLEVSMLEMNNENQVENLETGQLVRVVGKVDSEDEIKLRGEFVQDFSEFDLKLYKKAKEIIESED